MLNHQIAYMLKHPSSVYASLKMMDWKISIVLRSWIRKKTPQSMMSIMELETCSLFGSPSRCA